MTIARQRSRSFELVNLVVERMVSYPKQIQEMYGNLPQTARDHIADRDKGASS